MDVKDNPLSLTALRVYGVTIVFYTIVYMVLMILPFYILAQGNSNYHIGAIMGITMIASMFMRPFAGRLIDRYGCQSIIVVSLIVFAISLLGYLFQSLWIYWVIRLLQGVVAASFSTAMEIITIDLLSKRLRAQGLSLYSLATMIPTTFGPALSLYLIDRVSFDVLFISFFLLGIFNIIFALGLSINKSGTDKKTVTKVSTNHVKNNSLELIWSFVRTPNLSVPAFLMLLVSIANGAIFVFLPMFLVHVGSPHASTYFLVQMFVLVCARFIGRSYLPSDGVFPRGLTLVLCSMIGVGSLLIYNQQNVIALLLAAIFNGIGFALLYPTLLTFVSFHVDENTRAYQLALFIAAADLGFGLGSWGMGPFSDAWSLRAVFLLVGVLVMISLPVVLLLNNRRHFGI